MSIFQKGILKNLFKVKDEQTDPHPLVIPPTSSTPTMRYSIHQLQMLYDQGYTQPLDDVVWAFHKIMCKDPNDPYSFFFIGGLHGAPLQLRDGVSDDTKYWGGWCNHANVLFPTWHRVYCRYIEQALQSEVPGVGLPFLDETGEDAKLHGIPRILTDSEVYVKTRDTTIKNPLRSYTLQESLPDNYPADQFKYRKDKGYETVRFPYRGLVGTPEEVKKSNAYNSQFTDERGTELLNENFKLALEDDGTIDLDMDGIRYQYINTLSAPNYTVFSNTASAFSYNDGNNESGPNTNQFSLEGPHNSGHLYIGGFKALTESTAKDEDDDDGDEVILDNTEGDMANNNTAGLDPIFFFHHCFVDYVFWQWQRRNGKTEPGSVSIIPGYLGTSTSTGEFADSQGPALGQDFDQDLDMNSPLYPFKNTAGNYLTSTDSIKISDLGYDFGPGSLDLLGMRNSPYAAITADTRKKLRITKISRNRFRGSFIIFAFAILPSGQKKMIGKYVVFSRFDVEFCANCQTHMDINAIIPINHALASQILDGLSLKPGVKIILRYQAGGRRKLVKVSRDEDFSFEIKA